MRINNFFQPVSCYYITLIFKIFNQWTLYGLMYQQEIYLLSQNDSIYIFVHFSKRILHKIYNTLIIHFNFCNRYRRLNIEWKGNYRH